MAYIGSTPTTQSFIAGTDYFNGTGSAVSFTMSRAVNSVNDIEVIVNNVEQIPSGYSVSGTTLTFSAAPSAGTSNVYVRYLSTTNLSLAIPAGTSATFNTVTVADGSATTPSITNDGDTNTGIFFPAADTIAFSEGGAEVMRIDSSGNVGIGTSSPTDKLSVSGGGIKVTSGNVAVTDGTTSFQMGVDNFATGYGMGTTSNTPLIFAANGSERARIDSSGNLLVGLTTAATGWSKSIQVQDSSSAALCTSITGANARNWFTGTNSDGLWSAYDATASAYRMRISTGGNVGINFDPSGNARLVIGYDGTAQPGIRSYDTYSGVGTNNAWSIYRNASQVGTITTTLSATAYNTSSDYRLKEDITPMTGALATVVQLKPVTYKWKVDGSDGQGFIAHELQAIVPDCVTGAKDAIDAEGNPEYQGIDTSFLVATLTAAIQEQQALITALTTRITALENNNATQ